MAFDKKSYMKRYNREYTEKNRARRNFHRSNWAKRHPDRNLARNKKQLLKMKKIMAEVYGSSCEDCGTDKKICYAGEAEGKVGYARYRYFMKQGFPIDVSVLCKSCLMRRIVKNQL